MQLRNGKVVEALFSPHVSEGPVGQKHDIYAILDLLDSARKSRDRILFVGRLFRYLNDVHQMYGTNPKKSVLGSKRVIDAARQKGQEIMVSYHFMKPRNQAYFDKIAKADVMTFISLSHS